MFLLNCLSSRCLAMNNRFRISCLYLLLIIPQHGNSPLPVMDSWLKKDQDDGYVQRNMISSLTGGDESFGSAHQTYQNSLIRKKKSDSENVLPPMAYRKFSPNYRSQGDEKMYGSDQGDYNFDSPDAQREEAIFEEFDSESGLPANKNGFKTSNLRNIMGDNLKMQSLKRMNDKYVDIIPSKNLMYKDKMSHLREESDQSVYPVKEDMGRNPMWSLCKRLKARHALKCVENADPQAMEDRGNPEEFQMDNRQENGSPQVSDGNVEYYDAEDDIDYNQVLNGHQLKQKREENKQPVQGEQSETARDIMDPPKIREQDTGKLQCGAESMYFGPLREDIKSPSLTKTRDVSNKENTDSRLIWKLNSDAHTKDLNDLMQNSQRALKEVQMYQQKLALTGQDGSENDGYKQESGNSNAFDKKEVKFDDKRLKREDEDEQKNMKTGTDEGGGGEYEDEEGKGHKDEEEYYEDADLSDSESGNEGVRTTDDLNQRYVKREIPDGNSFQNSKDDQQDNNVEDYELSLENAPVEHAGKSRKSSLHGEGEKTKNNSARKGVKVWDQWGKWSPCSVTCGVGRSTRWRHCIGGGCAQGEKEAQIKRCTNPAC